MAREGVPLNVIQRQLGHADLGITSVYLQGIDSAEVISAVHGRNAPTMPASVGLVMQGVDWRVTLLPFAQSRSAAYSRSPAASRASSRVAYS
jgi:hypothetical protein